jgi:hypothetical protein
MRGVSHEHHTFFNPPPATPRDVRAAFDRNDLTGALDAMVGSALYGGGDRTEAQELFVELLDHENPQVPPLAATCLGHLARVYGALDEDRVVAALRRARSRGQISGTADDTLDDIRHYLHPRRAHSRRLLRRVVRPWTWI